MVRFNDMSVRLGIRGGLALSAVMAVVAVLTVVVFPQSPDESDDDPEYLVQILAVYAIVAICFTLIGVLARRRSDRPWTGAKAGAAMALVFALAVVVVYAVLDNVFFDIVSQQHDKRVAYAASGWTSMRAFINYQLVMGIPFVVPGAAVFGGALGALGAAIAPRSWRQAPGGESTSA